MQWNKQTINVTKNKSSSACNVKNMKHSFFIYDEMLKNKLNEIQIYVIWTDYWWQFLLWNLYQLSFFESSTWLVTFFKCTKPKISCSFVLYWAVDNNLFLLKSVSLTLSIAELQTVIHKNCIFGTLELNQACSQIIVLFIQFLHLFISVLQY